LGLTIHPPYFACDPDSAETKALREKYRKQRLEIYKEYQKGDFLEVTLKKLTEN
jgi:hypothetical protein